MADAADDMTLPTPRGLYIYLTIKDGRGQEAMDFYKRAFGASEEARRFGRDGHKVMHGRLTINQAMVMLSDDFPEFNNGVAGPDPGGVTFHLEVGDADAWFERAVGAGATIRMPLADQFWGDRYGQVTDPFGHRWSIGAPIRKA